MKYKKYPQYKDSGVEWLGEIPEHWNKSPLKFQLVNLDFRRIPISASERGDVQGNIPYYGASGIIDYVEDYIFNETTVLIGEDGANLLSKSTPLAFMATGKYWVNNHAHILKPKDKLYSFWTYMLNNLDLTPVISGSAQPKLTAEALGNLLVVLPNAINERKQLANYLDKATAKIDILIEKQTKLIELLKEKRQAVISTAVTRGLDSTVPMKDSEVEWLGKIPEHWDIKKFKYLFEIRKRISGKLGYDILSITQKGIKVKDIESGKGQLSSDYTKYQHVYKGDYAMNHMDLLTGFVDLSKHNGVTSPDYRVFSIIEKNADANYYLFLLQMGYINKIFYPLGQGSSQFGRWRLPSDAFKEFQAPFPPQEEQEEISRYIEESLEKFAKLTEKATKAIELLKERRAALISAVVTGKIDVRESI